MISSVSEPSDHLPTERTGLLRARRPSLARGLLLGAWVGLSAAFSACSEAGDGADAAATADAGGTDAAAIDSAVDAATPSDAREPLAQCIIGWWERVPASDCACAAQAECAASDCQRVRVRRFAADGTFVEGFVVRSLSLATMSTVGDLIEGDYQLVGTDGIVLGGATGSPSSVSCAATELHIGPFSDARVDAERSEKMEAAFDAHSLAWSSQPL
jgi:hypothetical protein